LKELPSEIAEKLVMSTETYSKELLDLLKQLDDTKTELNKLLKEKDEEILLTKEKNQQHEKDFEQKIQAQNDRIENLLATIDAKQKNEVDAVSSLETINQKLQEENLKLQKELELQVNIFFDVNCCFFDILRIEIKFGKRSKRIK
jgi:hypothetical protein